MLFAFLIGLSGSIGHCTGMCSGITLLLARRGMTTGWRWPVLHLGRITSYGLLGLVVGSMGTLMAGPMDHPHSMSGQHMANTLLFPQFGFVQGGVAVFAAIVTLYFALALIGLVPSPERLLTHISGRWGNVFRRLALADHSAPNFIASYGIGLLWGVLPCGLVLTALLAAAAAAAPLPAALTMIAFGLGTWPALLVVSILGRQTKRAPALWTRYIAAVLVCVFGAQLALRGMAAWGIVQHASIGKIMLW